MSPVHTHCLPTGSLATGEIPVPAFPAGAAVSGPSAGARRGIVVFLPGLGVSPVALPLVVQNSLGVSQIANLFQTLNNDGWLTIYASPPGYNIGASSQAAVLQTLLSDDATHGTLFLNAVLHWWDHVVAWIQATYGTALPIVVGGISMGGWTALSIAANRASTISGYFGQVPAVAPWTINPILALSFVGTPDATAAVASGSNNVALPISGGVLNYNTAVGTFPTAGTLVIVRGAGGWQIINYTGVTSSQFLGCTGGNTGNGNLATGDVIEHSSNTSGLDLSYTALNNVGKGQHGLVPPGFICWETGDTIVGFANQQLIYNNASAAGQPVTSNAESGGGHEMTNQDTSFITCPSWVSGANYAANSIVVSAGVPYVCAVTVNGSTTPPASDATHWSSAAITGGNTSTGWFQNALNPACPAVH